MPPLKTPGFIATNLLGWWSFQAADSAFFFLDSTLQSTTAFSGSSTICGAKDLSGNGFDLYWGAKHRQPLYNPANGAYFNRSALYNDGQILKAIKRTGFLSNVPNFYKAGIVKMPTPNPSFPRTLFQCSKGNATTDRATYQFTTSNNCFQRIITEPNDQTTSYSPTGTATTKPTQTAFDYLEAKVDVANNLTTFYKNGTNTETSALISVTGNTGLADPVWMSMGNSYSFITSTTGASSNSLDGYVKEFMVFSAIPGSTQQTSIQNYLAGRL